MATCPSPQPPVPSAHTYPSNITLSMPLYTHQLNKILSSKFLFVIKIIQWSMNTQDYAQNDYETVSCLSFNVFCLFVFCLICAPSSQSRGLQQCEVLTLLHCFLVGRITDLKFLQKSSGAHDLGILMTD